MASAFFRFYEELNDFLPPERHKVTFEHRFDHQGSVKDMIESLGVPHPEVEVILVDGRSVCFNHLVGDGERISVYPMFESIDVSPLLKLRPRPLRQPRFLLDVHLGTLARYLRLCGFDTLYRNDYDDDTLARTSVEDACTLLTRDRALLKRRIITHGYCVRNDKPRDQLAEVIERFDLYRAIEPFKRCAPCNGLLDAVKKSDIEHRLEPLTRRYYDEFKMCRSCNQLYWRGSHHRHIQQLIQAVMDGKLYPN